VSLIAIILLGCSLLLLLGATLHDLAVRTVPNIIPVLLTSIGIVLRLHDGDLVVALAASAATFAGGAVLWRHGWMGGGDVKLFAAAALIVPSVAVPDFLLAASIAGGVLAVAYLVMSRIVRPPAAQRPSGKLARALRCEQRRVRHLGPLPYASAIAAGAIFSLTMG
jgi:prepilin peptidase CpaA